MRIFLLTSAVKRAANSSAVKSQFAFLSTSNMANLPEGSVDLGSMRKPYEVGAFDVKDLEAKEPIGQFKAWFEEARANPAVEEPNAMCLATATPDGIPSARVVLLKSFSKEGFVFYTNGISQKGRELCANPKASLLFYWETAKRQVRIQGDVKRVPDEMAEEYFNSRPFVSRVGAAASKQSAVLADRAELDQRVANLTAEYAESNKVPRPETWGGYCVVPRSVEFWQGRTSRLHDRLIFRKKEDVAAEETRMEGEEGRVIQRLSP